MKESALDLDFFTYKIYYDFLANKFKDGDTFVEIGTWLGKSIIYLTEKVIKRNINMNIYTIDTFKGGPELKYYDIIINNQVYDIYLQNIAHIKEYITTIVGDSTEVHTQFEDESIDYIFIDGDHTHKGFKKDIECWFPKVKYGGIVSGHDYIWGGKGVKPIIDNFSNGDAAPFGFGDVWFYRKY